MTFTKTTPFRDRLLWAIRCSAFAALGLYWYARHTGKDWMYLKEIGNLPTFPKLNGRLEWSAITLAEL
jgi:hypothetical protein